MCGIFGFFRNGHILDSTSLDKMFSILRHRGPDQYGSFTTPEGLLLGHLRLSIHDVSESGRQPMVSRCGRYVIIFNGEIYNYKSLKDSLTKEYGVSWTGNSDTEVLLELIAKKGIDAALSKVDGMFAFAIFDSLHSKLVLARDRFGEKPLYIYHNSNDLIFSSEMSPIELVTDNLTLDVDAVAYQLRYSYIPDDMSIYQQVSKLLPGHYVVFEHIGNTFVQLSLVKYWSAVRCALEARGDRFDCTLEESVLNIEQSVERSIVERMDSDVPLGAFLSGGIDSTCVTALMQKNSSTRINTFSIGFDDYNYNEAHHAKAVANVLGTNHHELYLTPKDVMDVIPSIAMIYDEPFSDSSQIPTFIVSRFAKKKVSVALTGDAGDELFGGYNRHFLGDSLQKLLTRYPVSVRRVLSTILKSQSANSYDFYGKIARKLTAGRLDVKNIGDKLHKLARIVDSNDEIDLYSRLINAGSAQLSTITVDNLVDIELFGTESLSVAEKMMLQDTIGYLRNDILTKVDRASMANSLETRVPFLSLDVFKTAWRTPIEHKIVNGVGKYPLKTIVHRYVPKHLVERPKTGFGIPIYQWLRGELRPWAESLLSKESLSKSGCINVQEVRQLWNCHLAGKGNFQYELWNVLMFQQWFLSK